jgi:subtilase family serine protease
MRPIAIVAASIVLSSAALPAQTQTSPSVLPSRIVNTIDENSRVTLHGYVHPLATAANDRGAAPDSMPLTRVHLLLKRSDAQETALQQYISEAHTPGSASYHKWLTPAQFGQQFGPSDQDIATVESWLSSHGFEVSGVKPGKQVIEFSGNVAQLRTAFHTQIHQYNVNGATHYGAANEPDIPAALATVVAGFPSLNDFPPHKLLARVLGTASYNAKTDKATPNWTYGTSSAFSFVLAPGDFGIQYDLPNSALNSKYTGSNLDGTGQSIAILDFANINVDLVNQFRTIFGLPANTPNVIIDGNDPGIDGINNPDGENYASIESYLDVEWAGAVAPNATIDLVIGADTALESGGILAAEHAVYGNVAPIISVSIDVGGCEQEAGSINPFISGLWEQAAAQGQTVVVAAGDSGAAGCDNDNTEEYAIYGLGVNSWASTPYNVAAGGTDFYYSDYATSSALDTQLGTYWSTTTSQTPKTSILGYIPEQPWNDSQFGLNAVNYYSATGATSIVGGSGGASNSAVCTGGYSSTTGA